jgi:K+-transporting ATPase ATPase B chain
LQIYSFATKNKKELASALKTNVVSGLSPAEARVRLEKYGRNEVKGKPVPWWEILLRQFRSPFLYLLALAAVVSFSFGQITDGVVIIVFVCINSGLGFLQEYHSENILRGLEKYIESSVSVIREDDVMHVPGSEIVPGDLIVLESGNKIPADVRFLSFDTMRVDESVLTGESFVNDKVCEPLKRVPAGVTAATNLGFAGSSVVAGKGIALVLATGRDTQLGAVSELTLKTRHRSNFEKGLTRLSNALLLIVVSTVVLVSLAHIVFNRGTTSTHEIILFSIAIAVTVIPESLPTIMTFSLSRGAVHLAKKKVVVKRLSAIEDLGGIEILATDKTGTITLGNRQAVEFIPTEGVAAQELADAAQISSLSDETPEGRSIVVLAKEKYGIRERHVHDLGATFIPFTAQTRMSGVDLKDGRHIRKGAADAIEAYVRASGGSLHNGMRASVEQIAKGGGTPLVVADGKRILGVIHLKDIVKGGIKDRFAELRGMGIKTIMITGDNPLTAAAIAAEAGVDDFLAQATPETKLKLIRDTQQGGRLVAMTGDGTNDAPALAQADVAVAMNTGTQAAKEAGNMVDLDSNPTKLLEIVEIGKQLLMTRGSLTTFSIANDVSKYFAIIPAAFATTYPALKFLNVMHLATPSSAILSAVIFNAIIIIFLIPLALRGVAYRAVAASRLLRDNFTIYGFGGLMAPFIGIKLIDMLLVAFHLV